MLWLCVAAAGAYVITGAAVLVSRARYQHRQRIVRRLERAVLHGRATAASTVLGRRRLRLLLDIAAESALSKDSEQALALVLVARMGTPEFRGAASDERRNRRRLAALRAVAVAGRDEAWACFGAALECSSPDVSAAVVTMLGRIADRRAATLLVEALRSGRHARSRVATALDAFPLPIGDLISPLLAAAAAYDRYWGALLMRRYPDAPGLQRTLTGLARDHEPLVRRAAIETIAAVGFKGATDLVARLTTDPVPFVRTHAARALGRLGAADHASVLLPLMGDREWIVRAAAKQSLESMGAPVAGLVTGLLSNPDAFARDGASEVLRSLGAHPASHARLGETASLS